MDGITYNSRGVWFIIFLVLLFVVLVIAFIYWHYTV